MRLEKRGGEGWRSRPERSDVYIALTVARATVQAECDAMRANEGEGKAPSLMVGFVDFRFPRFGAYFPEVRRAGTTESVVSLLSRITRNESGCPAVA